MGKSIKKNIGEGHKCRKLEKRFKFWPRKTKSCTVDGKTTQGLGPFFIFWNLITGWKLVVLTFYVQHLSQQRFNITGMAKRFQ